MAAEVRRVATPVSEAVSEAGTPVPAAGPLAGRPATATPVGPTGPTGVLAQLYAEPFRFDFFQAVRVLEKAGGRPVGREGPPAREAVRLRARASLDFPPSMLYEIEPATPARPVPRLTVAFMGLYGPSGVLPRFYTEMVLRLAREAKGPERTALRDWFDVFNHRVLSLFYRAWEKYRFWRPYERGEAFGPTPDTFTAALYALVGLGTPGLRGRLVVGARGVGSPTAKPGGEGEKAPDRPLARIDDLALLAYAGLFAHRPRNAVSLAALLSDYFGVRAEVRQFQGRWLVLEPANQSRLGAEDGNCRLGVDLVAGDRVWDVQGKFRIRLGPLTRREFASWLPDRSPEGGDKRFFLLCHLTRLYAGPEFDFDVQLVLRADEVPPLELADGPAAPRLGWDTWLTAGPAEHDADDAAFEGETVVEV